ncbi:LacI family DNA-binding transcriptional regulator [Paenibacillus senegalensis]|uniref:LacI family DNA-binding transcriptional regulator n=1 Tax=Paenibacillus senegalensis TaxID=1465766 RepID=UPI00028A4041|nr:LacI family DNA-binding transcriptional regulator [Paenibacillus senegalensis]
MQLTKVTLKDIADRANVSISSVSRALNKAHPDAPVNDQTREHIIRVAKELGYRKINSSQKSNENISEIKVGLILNNVKAKYQDAYFSEIIFGIESELLNNGITLDFTFEVKEIFNSNLFADFPKENLGVICIGPLKSQFLNELAKQVPLVFSVSGLPQKKLDCVTVDFRDAAREAVQYLVDLGHRKIAFIGGGSPVGASMEEEERTLGYKDALKANGISIVPEWFCDGKFSLAKSYEAMAEILRSPERPTALFAASDMMAHGAYKAIKEAGLRIPEDLSVVSFDDIEMSEFVSPALTTVRVPKEEMGRTAVKLLLQRMTGKLPLPMSCSLPTELMIRNSSGKNR